MPGKKVESGKKRGPKCHFTGSREEFLYSYLDQYMALRGKDRGRFWLEFFGTWWEKYPWRLSDHTEPPSDDPEKMAELAFVGAEDLTAKANVEQQLDSRIRVWFQYRSSVHNSQRKGGNWAPLLRQIHRQANPKPRRRTAAQKLMREKPEVVSEAFQAQYGDGETMGPGERLNRRNELAKQLVSTEFKKDEEDLAQRAQEDHERCLKEWGLQLTSIDEAEDVHLARDGLFSAVHPLLNVVGSYTGCYVTLVAAAPASDKDGKPYFSAIHHFPQATGMRVNWTEFDEEAFKNGVVSPFFKYIRWKEGMKFDETEAAETVQSGTTTIPLVCPPSAGQSNSVRSQRAPPGTTNTKTATPALSGRYKKRTFTEVDEVAGEVTDDEDETDMDNVEDYDSSGDSVDSNHVPAKRLRTAMGTRSSESVVTSEFTVSETNSRQVSPSAASDGGILFSNSDFSPSRSVTPARSDPTSMDVDNDHIGSGARDVTAGAQTRQPVDTPIVARLPSSSTLAPDPDHQKDLPDFLRGKHDVYGYLAKLKEPGFQDLLENYIAFELTDNSNIRGALTTCNRPAAIKWWYGRSRPDKLPPFDSLKTFSGGIVKWWTTLQPDWRRIKLGEVSRIGGSFEDWEPLYQPGNNGLLNIVILAYWWGKILESRRAPAGSSYSWFVSDVSFVLTQLASVAADAS